MKGGSYMAACACVDRGWAVLVGRDLVGGHFARTPAGRRALATSVQLTRGQWDALLGLAQAKERGVSQSTSTHRRILSDVGFTDGAGRITDKGWFFVRDEISSGRRKATIGGSK
jgi:hypothetical protein